MEVGDPDSPDCCWNQGLLFSPVVNVSYRVEETRVGQRTDYEKLILEVNTDGSLTPDDALTFAGKIWVRGMVDSDKAC